MKVSMMRSPDREFLANSRWDAPLTPGLVSTIMPAYNCAGSIASAIESILSQSYPDWELVVVDDKSNDNTAEIAREFAARDSRIRVLCKSKNEGVARARNYGLAAARGQYVSFLDADDLWMPEKLAVQVGFLQERNAAFCFSSYSRFNGAGTSKPVPVPEQIDYDGLLRGNVIACLTVLLDRTKIEPFKMPSVPHEDYATWLSILRAKHVAYGIPVDLARYRVSRNSLSGNKLRAAVWTWNIYRNQEELTLLRAARCFAYYVFRAISINRFQNRVAAKRST
jgi:teichuronic acid biosynthesis glycosyltransferase TuaG